MTKELDFNEKNKRARIKLIVTRVLSYTFLIVLTLFCLSFFYLLINNSTKSNADLLDVTKTLLPSVHFFKNFYNTLFRPSSTYVNVLSGLKNSMIVALLSSLLTCYFSSLTAYGVYAYNFKGKKIVAAFILAIMMIPSQLSSVGFLEMAYSLKLRNQLWLLIVPSIAAPATYYYMHQYLKATLPLELIEASRMDGSNEFMTFNRIVLPIMKPALAVQMIFSFVASWNNYYMPGLLLDKTNKTTLPIMLGLLRSDAVAKVDNGQIWMVILLSILPVIVIYLILSRSIIKGVTSGSVKG